MSVRKIIICFMLFLILFSGCRQSSLDLDIPTLIPEPSNTPAATLPLPEITEIPSVEVPEETFTITYIKYDPPDDIEPLFSPKYACSENIIRYAADVGDKILYGFMNMEFEMLTGPDYVAPSVFTNGLALVRGIEGGSKIINKNFDEYRLFRNKYVLIGDQLIEYGAVDFTPHIMVDCSLDNYNSSRTYGIIEFALIDTGVDELDTILIPAGDFYSNEADGESEIKFGYTTLADLMDNDGGRVIEYVIDPVFENARTFNDGMAAVQMNGKWGFIDENYELIVECQYDEVSDYSNGVAFVGSSNGYGEYEQKLFKWAVVDNSGELLTNFKYDDYEQFSDGFARVFIQSNVLPRWIFINDEGEEIFGEFTRAYKSFQDEIGIIEKSNKLVFIDIYGNEITSLSGHNIHEFHNGVSPYYAYAKWGYIDKYGNILIDAREGYGYAGLYSKGLMFVRESIGSNKSKDSGYLIDINGNRYLEELKLTNASEFNEDGYALAFRDIEDGDNSNRIYYILHIEPSS